MTQYIDKAALVAEIEKLIDEIYAGQPFDSLSNEQQTTLWYVKSIMSSINTIEIKEVDLEKEIKDYLRKQPIVARSQGTDFRLVPSPEEIAKHFFELGLKTKERISYEQRK